MAFFAGNRRAGYMLAAGPANVYLGSKTTEKENAMPPVLSYKWRRDPEHLVQRAGLGTRVQSWSEEKRFLTALDAMPETEDRKSVV